MMNRLAIRVKRMTKILKCLTARASSLSDKKTIKLPIQFGLVNTKVRILMQEIHKSKSIRQLIYL